MGPTYKVYSDGTFRKALGISEDFIVLRYADTVLVKTSSEYLQTLLNCMVEYSVEAGLELNINKTQLMVISKIPNVAAKIEIGGTYFESF